ncbi:BRO family protein [Azospirillum sp. 11R-A]|uniref:BRO-N domain-containing protein n=1 Tax=Azospirillum sp. 11R-A TaxID=3111634 RepID=UPI003C22DFA6
MTKVHSFVFPASAGPISIRTVEIDGAPWFMAVDACRALGLSTYAGTTVHLKTLTADERQGHSLPSLNRLLGGGVDRAFFGGAGLQTLISESGLYKLVMRSDKPEARKFQDWVTRDVLPAIRKDGGYIMGEEGRGMGTLRDSLQRFHRCPLPM